VTPTQARGDQLTAEDQKDVLAAYVHRHTREHRPAWANKLWNGKPYPVQFASDAEWLANTLFAVRRNGRLDQRARSCESHPTWPDNPELR
jgi:hypothetical protein